jgi:hypothetical protein
VLPVLHMPEVPYEPEVPNEPALPATVVTATGAWRADTRPLAGTWLLTLTMYASAGERRPVLRVRGRTPAL